MSKLDSGDLSYEDLVEYAIDLEQQLETANNEIAELNKQQIGKGRGKKGSGADTAYYEQENRSLREKIEEDTATITKLRDDLATANVKINDFASVKAELDSRIRTYTKRIEDLERDNNNLMHKSQTVEEKSREVNKQKSDNVKVAQQMAQENETLRDENKQLTEQVKGFKKKVADLEDVLVKYAGEKELVEAHRDNLDVEKDALRSRIAELEADLIEVADQVQESIKAENAWEQKYNALQAELQKTQAKNVSDLAKAKADTANLQQQIAAIQDTTQLGKMQKQLSQVQEDYEANTKLIAELQTFLTDAVEERDALAEELKDYETQIDQRIADRMADERNRVKKLDALIERMKQEKEADAEYYKKQDEEKRALTKQVDELLKWKSVYEAGHGLQHLAKAEKKLSDDVKRYTKALEDQANELGKVMGTNQILSIAFERLKKECGKPANFHYSDLELHREVESTSATLQSQVKDLERQVDFFEEENTRLHTALRNQAGSYTEDGFKFPGMDADMLMKVNEFAANVRAGKLDLPLNDRSRQLFEENNKLKVELKTLNMQLLSYEKNLTSGGGDNIVNDVFGADMKKLIEENAEVHKKMRDLQMQIDLLLKSQSNGVIKASDLSAILSANNELVLKELEELRRSQQHLQLQPLSSRTDGGLPPSGRLRGIGRAPDSAASKGGNESKLVLDITPAKPSSSVDLVQSAPGTAYWTPRIGKGGMPFAQTPGPATPHGKQLLNNTLYNMNLPPEDWAVDVRELNSQLIECLEQLYEREEELASQKEVLTSYEQNLGEIKTQMIILYHDYAENSKKWESKEKQLVEDQKSLVAERDGLRLKVNRFEEMTKSLQNRDEKNMEQRIAELTRKMTIYESNEAILSRKYISLSEQCETESKKRVQLELDFAEMESTLKQRILFLEQYKLAAGSRLAFVQGKLDNSIPQEDYLALQTEMESLREDHLLTLRREVEARAAALKSLDRARELRSLRLVLAHQQEDLEKTRTTALNLQAELLHQREVTEKALAAVQSSAEVSKLITELAKYRGEASRLEVELLGSNRRAELLSDNLSEVANEVEQLSARVKELERREEDYLKRQNEARKELLAFKLQYENGLSRDEKDAIKLKCEKLELSLADAQREMTRLKELAEIATNQAQSLTQYKQTREEEITELREYCTRLESRSEDEILIGRLQRQLMSTKMSYKAFVRRYQLAREGVRTREIALRIVETRLSDQEKLYHESSAARRKELLSLKKALRDIREIVIESVPISSGLGNKKDNLTAKDNLSESVKDAAALKVAAISKLLTNKGSKLVTSRLGSRVVEISEKVDHLEELAERAVTQAAQKEEECRRLMGDVEELQAEKSILQQRLSDLDIIINGSVAKQQTVAARLISLSEEVRMTKISNIKQRRQLQGSREETKHLRTLIAKMEADMVDLEKGKVNSEASEFFAANLADGKNGGKSILDSIGEDPMEHELKNSMSKLSIQTDNLDLDGDMVEFDKENLDGNHPSNNVNAMKEQVHVAQKEISDLNLKANSLNGRLTEMQLLIEEKDSQLAYYEKVLTEQGLGNVMLRDQKVRKSAQKPSGSSGISAVEQEKLQEAATATIGSLKALIEEKNRLIEKYREKIDQLMNSGHKKSRAERHAEDILERIHHDEGQHRGAKVSQSIEITSLSSFPGGGAGGNEMIKRLEGRLEQADSLIADKDKTIMQLEQNLAMQVNQRERAELRCGEALNEMDAMKSDLITLAQQLQESEARCTHLSRNTASSVKVVAPESTAKVRELEKIIRTKEEKVKGYREIIVRLKEEFIKSEQEKAVAEIQSRTKHDTGAAISPEELRDLKSKVSDMYGGLRNAKDDLEKARRAREKLAQERNAALDEVKRLEEQLSKTESQAMHGQQMVNRLKKDLDDSNRKLSRLRDKHKEYLDTNTNAVTNKATKDLAVKAKDRIEQLEREIDLLKAQNAALRKADVVDAMISRDLRGTSAHGGGRTAFAEEREERKAGAESPSRGGKVLGGGTGGVDDVRQQLHAKWESEKKLQKRVGVLEGRLQEVLTENEELRAQLQKGKDSLHNALTAKEEMQKKVHSAQKHTVESRKHSAEEVLELEEAHARIYSLEEQLQSLTRRADVEQLNQIRSLSHQLSVSQSRVSELERAVQEMEEKKKKASSSSATATGRSVRESEERFLREERLRDELDFTRRQKVELEGALLERDAKMLEQKFDMEALEGETSRLKRRVKEVEQAYRSLQQVLGSGTGKRDGERDLFFGGGVLGGGRANASKREVELEGAIEAMKRVVEKLRGENDRLKRGIGTGVGEGGASKGPGEGEKKYQQEKKRGDKLEEELRILQEKLKVNEEGSQKVVAKQQQIAQLRKQLKGKEEEMGSVREEMDRQVAERDIFKKKSKALEERVQALEAALQQAQAAKSTAAVGQAGEGEMRRRLSAQQAENDVLKAELEQVQRKLRDLSGPSSSGQAASAGELKKLREENEKLKAELSAFDMDFFEEIENLKYAHAEALRKLRAYEARGR